MASRLVDDDIAALIVAKTPKNYSDASHEFEARVKAKRFRHDGNPCLRWMASNVVVTRKVDGSILPKKETHSSRNKIDGIDAVIMAIGRMLAGEEEAPWEVADDYECVA